MNKKIFVLAACMFLSLSNNLFAQTQIESNQTAKKRYDTLDKEMKRLYSKLLKNIGTEAAKLLEKAQEDWIKFRDSQCKFNASMYDGRSIRSLVYSTCLEEGTKTRIAQLKKNLKEINK